MTSQNKKYIIIIIFLIFSLSAALILSNTTTIFFSKAHQSNSSTSFLSNSYLFASPLQAESNSTQKIRISVFILDQTGLGISNQPVTLVSDPQLSISPIQPISDDYGAAYFDLSSTSASTFTISASINQKSLPQKVKVIFY